MIPLHCCTFLGEFQCVALLNQRESTSFEGFEYVLPKAPFIAYLLGNRCWAERFTHSLRTVFTSTYREGNWSSEWLRTLCTHTQQVLRNTVPRHPVQGTRVWGWTCAWWLGFGHTEEKWLFRLPSEAAQALLPRAPLLSFTDRKPPRSPPKELEQSQAGAQLREDTLCPLAPKVQTASVQASEPRRPSHFSEEGEEAWGGGTTY